MSNGPAKRQIRRCRLCTDRTTRGAILQSNDRMVDRRSASSIASMRGHSFSEYRMDAINGTSSDGDSPERRLTHFGRLMAAGSRRQRSCHSWTFGSRRYPSSLTRPSTFGSDRRCAMQPTCFWSPCVRRLVRRSTVPLRDSRSDRTAVRPMERRTSMAANRAGPGPSTAPGQGALAPSVPGPEGPTIQGLEPDSTRQLLPPG